jgi:hypothetical protein
MPPCILLRDWYGSGKSDHGGIRRSIPLIFRTRFLHFTVNHYTLATKILT